MSSSANENKPMLLATRLQEINQRRRTHIAPSSSNTHQNDRIQQNITNMKHYIAEVSEASKSKNLQYESDGKDEHRGYEHIRKDLLLLHRQQSLEQNMVTWNPNANAQLTDIMLESPILNLVPYKDTEEHVPSMIPSKDGTCKLKGQPHRYAKDYIAMAKEYKRMESYRCNNTEMFQNLCIQCEAMVFKSNVPNKESRSQPSIRSSLSTIDRANKLSKVFFPCEHLCVCNACFNNKGPWHTCPLCNQNVKVVFEHSGRETEEYWKWVNEIKPKLSSSFRKTFPRFSRRAIAEAMAKSVEDAYSSVDDGNVESLSDDAELDDAVKSKACIIS